MTQASGMMMGLLNDAEIARLCEGGMITPAVAQLVRHVDIETGYPVTRADAHSRKVISYGLTSFGYDIRAGSQWSVFDPLAEGVVDPKDFNPRLLRVVDPKEEDDDGNLFVLVPANSYALCSSMEKFDMPDDVVGIAVGKSTYARCGIIVNVTPLEPGWRGYLTIEVSNDAPRDARIYVGEGILQVQFWRGSRPSTTYADRGGKYQDQAAGPVPARL